MANTIADKGSKVNEDNNSSSNDAFL